MTKHHLDQHFRTFLLNKIAEEWTEIPSNGRPLTFWVAEHEPTDILDSPIDTPILDGWHFDGNGFRKRPISDIAAFLNLAVGYPNNSGCFEIGIAGFAPITNSHDVLLFWQFGGLHGIGYKCSKDGCSYSCHETWRS